MKRVLFVDTGNSIVGPMAEAWFNRHASGCGVASSCGTLPAEWINAPVVQAMYEVGIDIGYKLPKGIDLRMLAQSDVVVLMGVHLKMPDGVEKRAWDVREPFNPSFEEARALRDQIRQRVDELIGEIQRSNRETGLTDAQWRIAIVNLLSM
jgi:arsenate reductase